MEKRFGYSDGGLAVKRAAAGELELRDVVVEVVDDVVGADLTARASATQISEKNQEAGIKDPIVVNTACATICSSRDAKECKCKCNGRKRPK